MRFCGPSANRPARKNAARASSTPPGGRFLFARPPFSHANNPFVNRAENSFLRFWNYHTVAITQADDFFFPLRSVITGETIPDFPRTIRMISLLDGMFSPPFWNCRRAAGAVLTWDQRTARSLS